MGSVGYEECPMTVTMKTELGKSKKKAKEKNRKTEKVNATNRKKQKQQKEQKSSSSGFQNCRENIDPVFGV